MPNEVSSQPFSQSFFPQMSKKDISRIVNQFSHKRFASFTSPHCVTLAIVLSSFREVIVPFRKDVCEASR